MPFHPPPPTFASRRRKPAAGLASHTAQRDAGAVPTATVTPLPDVCFGATVTDVDLGALDDIGFAAIYDAWLLHGLLVFPAQHLDRDAQDAFARRFGPLEFEASPLANVDRHGNVRATDGSDDMMQILIGNMDWHQDSTYMPVQAKGAVFSAEVVPTEGGATGFADTAAAYDTLSPPLRAAVAGRTARHSLYHSQALIGHDGTQRTRGYSGYGFHDEPISVRPLVKIHPETGRRVLTIGRHAHDVVGLESGPSRTLLDSLVEHTCRPPRVHHHQWCAGDVLVWDNRRLLHCATPWPFEQPRVMWHTRLAGDPATESSLRRP